LAFHCFKGNLVAGTMVNASNYSPGISLMASRKAGTALTGVVLCTR
jgi:hypothetical protein